MVCYSSLLKAYRKFTKQLVNTRQNNRTSRVYRKILIFTPRWDHKLSHANVYRAQQTSKKNGTNVIFEWRHTDKSRHILRSRLDTRCGVIISKNEYQSELVTQRISKNYDQSASSAWPQVANSYHSDTICNQIYYRKQMIGPRYSWKKG